MHVNNWICIICDPLIEVFSPVAQVDIETDGSPLSSVALVLRLQLCATLNGCFFIFSVHTDLVVILGYKRSLPNLIVTFFGVKCDMYSAIIFRVQNSLHL